MIEFFKKIFCFSLLIVVAISYMDVFNPDGAVQSSLSTLFKNMTILLFAISFRWAVFSSNFTKHYLLILLCVFVSALAADAIFSSSEYFQDLMNLIISFVCVCIGYNMTFGNRDIKFMYILYGIALLFTGATLIDNNIGGLLITDDYKIHSKNGIGAMIASFAVSMFVFCSDKSSKWWKVVSIITILLSVVILLTIRARASTMTVFISLFIYCIQLVRCGVFSLNKLIKWSLFIIPILVVVIYIVGVDFSFASEYIYNSLFQNVEDDVTTGRADRNVIAWDFFMTHPLFGRLVEPINLSWVHNYLLRVLADYGMIGGASLVVLYVYLTYRVVSVHWKYNTLASVEYIGYWAILPLLLLSVVEPLFPYSPGTSVMFSFMLLGYSNKFLRCDKNNIKLQRYE